jgi:hypothetical protein
MSGLRSKLWLPILTRQYLNQKCNSIATTNQQHTQLHGSLRHLLLSSHLFKDVLQMRKLFADNDRTSSGNRKWWPIIIFYCLVCEAIGTAATPGLLCQPRVIMKLIVEQMVCRLPGDTEVLGENLPQRQFCPSQNPT